jgi:hypothetical protein
VKTIANNPEKKPRPASKRGREILTEAQVLKAKAMLAELDALYGGRNTGSVDFLLKMRRGEA